MPGQGATPWTVAPRNEKFEREVALATGIHPLVAAVLHSRGLTTIEEIATFVHPSLDNLNDPDTLPDIGPAVDRLVAAIQHQETVLVHGDYDADGICAAALLTRFISTLGADVRYHIPHRINDHYGLSSLAVEQAAKSGVKLIIAVDCGVSAIEPIAAARAAGADVIVVDHHEPGPQLPEGAWIIDPKRADNKYPQRDLASVGLSFKLASALCKRLELSQRSLQRAYLDLVALGTIADQVPLVGENRILVAKGLNILPHTRKVGLQALLRVCQLNSKVTASDVAFRLAPRLNAVGRMADATEALELLLTDDQHTAPRDALRLDSINRQRQQEQERVYYEALRKIDEEIDLEQDRIIVLGSPNWHLGVVGIVASRLLEKYHRPAILLVQEDDQLRGSARSTGGFDIARALQQCSDLLLRHGGHAAAAGMTLAAGKLAAFRERLNLLAAESIAPEDIRPQVQADVQVELFEIDAELAESLLLLDPCGQGNPEPRFVARAVPVVDCQLVGSNKQHLKLHVAGDEHALECIGFGMSSQVQATQRGSQVDICFTPEIDEYQGQRQLQLRLAAVKPSTADSRS